MSSRIGTLSPTSSAPRRYKPRRLVFRISAIPAVEWELMTTAQYDPQDIVREMIRVAEAEGIEP